MIEEEVKEEGNRGERKQEGKERRKKMVH